MHKGVILLVKATDRDEAIEKVNEFMEPYGDGKVWDWFSIGNRWHNTLAPSNKVAAFEKKAKKLYPQLSAESYAVNEIENAKDRPIIQKLWEDQGLSGMNPYYSSYGFDVKDTPKDYNVVPLSECLDIVKKWLKNREAAAEEYFIKMVKEHKSEKKKGGKLTMSAYYAGIYKNLKYGDFSFECNVFDIEYGESEHLPEESLNEYFAVMVDMHN